MSDTLFPKDDLEKMYSALSHRGPDAEGFYLNETVGLGHRRLSILDVSANSNQPFFSASGRYVIIYNGEVYNASELAKQYSISTRTSSDTEVIVELFEKLGPAFVSLLNGMFVIIIYDIQQNTLHVFRDRCGIKPLFYFIDNSYFIFGSEIKALTALAYVKNSLTINSKSLASFLHLGFFPEPATIYNNIFKFPSGHYFAISKKGVDKQNYWKLESQVNKDVISDFEEAKILIKDLLQKSIKSQLLSDVPLGVLLSGGIDSSLIASIAQQYHSKPIKTFTVGIKDSLTNETQFAREVSKYIGSDHFEFLITKTDLVNNWEKILDDFDEPFGDSSSLPTYLLSIFHSPLP